jgi:hypothetical protein
MEMVAGGSNPSAEENGAISGAFYFRENSC